MYILIKMIKVKDGFEPSLQNLQFYTLPLCYLTTLNLKRLIIKKEKVGFEPTVPVRYFSFQN